MEKYFNYINKEVERAYLKTKEVKDKGLDPIAEIEIPIARSMAERVEGLISSVAPQIKDSGMVNRIYELEKKYGKLDWRVAFEIAREVAQEKFCNFKDKLEAMEVGIRVGIAYVTNGVVASPLEGFTQLKLRKRKDGKEYFSLFFSGPIRSAGGTGASISVLIADYVRVNSGYDKYDPTEEEIKRMYTELLDYHEKVTNLQYLPSEEETHFMMGNLPVQIDGDPSEKYDVSNYKDLERIDTNKLRNGPCLVIGEGLTQKAPKLWKQLAVWGEEMGMGHWKFLNDFLKLQKRVKSKEKKGSEETKGKLKPDYTFIVDLVAGRPVLTHPLRTGGFRLRYGRCRNSGLSSMAISPYTMHILDKYIAIGTQLKTERPSKGTALSSCDSIEGPIVKLKDGSVVFVDSEEKLLKCLGNVEEITFLGDILVNYGDFLDRAHVLVPCGYNEEWWLREFENVVTKKFKKIDFDKLKEFLNLKKEFLEKLFSNFSEKIGFDDALKISKKFKISLHPRWTYHWNDISKEMFLSLFNWFKNVVVKDGKVILPFSYNVNKDLKEEDPKRALELIGLEHEIVSNEYVVIKGDDAKSFSYIMEGISSLDLKEKDVLEIINNNLDINIKDKSGTFIGARMGRPEKAKMRKLKGSPNVLFPVGEEGGKLRSFQSAMEKGKVRAQFPIYYCSKCNRETIFPYCEKCLGKTEKKYFCEGCGKTLFKECEKHKTSKNYKFYELNIEDYFNSSLKLLNLKSYPDLVKGVRGTSNVDHTPEDLVKGILRASYNLYVNKDGTIRYDMTELVITAFKPVEIGTSVERLRELGYEKDIYGKDLVNEDQVLMLKVQDVILPSCKESAEEGADIIFYRISKFIDDLLTRFYKVGSFYNLKNKGDLVGHLVVALAPHISAGVIGRIIGFSETQGFYAHPYFHCAVRRDCFDYDTFIPIKQNKNWRVVKIGDLVEDLNPERIIDDYGTKEKKITGFSTIGFDKNLKEVKINNFTKHTKSLIFEIKTALGKKIKVTKNHKFLVDGEIKRTSDLKIGDRLCLPRKIKINSKDLKKINLLEFLKDENLMVRKIKSIVNKINYMEKQKILKRVGITKKQFQNFNIRDSYPVKFVLKLSNKYKKEIFMNGMLAAKRDNVEVPIIIALNKPLLELIGLYVAEGYSRNVGGKKGLNQVCISSYEKELIEFVKKTIKKSFGLECSKGRWGNLVFSSKILHLFFTKILECGNAARYKRIPYLFLDLKLDKLAHFLRGYFEGDGSVSLSDRRVSCDSVSQGLLFDLEFCLSRFGIFSKRYEYEKEPGPQVREFYIRKKRKIPKFKITKMIIGSDFVEKFMKIGFLSKRKRSILNYHKNRNFMGMRIKYDDNFVYDPIISIDSIGKKESYCLNVNTKNHLVVANSIVTAQCDGDELAVILLMDALINFSRKYLPSHRGARQDTPLVLSPNIIPGEVDDMVFKMDVVDKYPLEFYDAAEQYKQPWDVKIETVNDRLGGEKEYYCYEFTHDTSNINDGVRCSAYKSIPTMEEKVIGQMHLAEKIRAVDEIDVARLIIDRHFLRDIKGNLRKFSQQEFRCVNCNEKYRRPPLIGNCLKCGGRIIFTVSEGSIIKYLQPSLSLAEKFELPPYLKQSLDLTRMMIESVFGRDKEKQEGLGKWFG
ncbi:MAG: DNA polymerase II large subunit [Nanoarchaeota archaeon]|nr:DNA polymerase II large subunit [Nanoarchaeota archaeon]